MSSRQRTPIDEVQRPDAPTQERRPGRATSSTRTPAPAHRPSTEQDQRRAARPLSETIGHRLDPNTRAWVADLAAGPRPLEGEDHRITGASKRTDESWEDFHARAKARKEQLAATAERQATAAALVGTPTPDDARQAFLDATAARIAVWNAEGRAA